jgi:hypothetical protein
MDHLDQQCRQTRAIKQGVIMKANFYLPMLLSAVLSGNASASSFITSDTVVVFVLAQGDRCISDHPLMADEMSVAMGNWMQRNSQTIDAARKTKDFEAAYALSKHIVLDQRLQTRKHCTELVQNLNDQGQDLDKRDRK